MSDPHLKTPSFSILIPTYGRDEVLINTISALLALPAPASEIVILDQTANHPEECEAQLSQWHETKAIRWIRIPYPSITVAMNLGLVIAESERVLFLDDDIIPDQHLLTAHRHAAQEYPNACIAGRVLQPWHQGQADPEDLPFGFNSLVGRSHHEFMGGNVSIDRLMALSIGGFDRNFVRVAYRFEAEFASRWLRAGHSIRYEPQALIHHLRIRSGGTRSYGHHLTTIRPDHAVGRYYYYWRTNSPALAVAKSIRNFFSSVYTRHHLHKPWWIPVTLFAELRGFLWSCSLALSKPSLQQSPPIKLLIIASHPIQYQVPIFRILAADPRIDLKVLFLTLPDAAAQGDGFGVPFQWDIPMLNGYKWSQAKTQNGPGGFSQFSDLKLKHPFAELNRPFNGPPDVMLINGWQYMGLLQLFIAARMKGISALLRMENTDKKPRGLMSRFLHRLILNQCSFVLPVGISNSHYYRKLGIDSKRMVRSPYCVDNLHFNSTADQARSQRHKLRQNWHVPPDAFCFLFCGKFEEKKYPQDILDALMILKKSGSSAKIHCIFVGSGVLESQLKAQVESADLPVTFAGFLNQLELSAAYAAVDALVLPSNCYETWGLVVNEAMACGLPAIVSDQVGCVEDLIEPGITGLRYPFHQVDRLADAMAKMASDSTASQLMGRNAYNLIHSNYSIETAAAGIRHAALLAFCHSSN
jgi:glycosyltransferase involved in cell wall biosynthesis